MKPTMVTHIGSTTCGSTFAWANYEDTVKAMKIVLTIGCMTTPDHTLFLDRPADEARGIRHALDTLHLEKIAEAHEVLVLNLTGYIGQRTLHELCYAYNLGKRIRWMEEWPMYCPRCGCEGPESDHFFHNPLSLPALHALLADEATHDYLPGQLVNWYGRIAPVVRLAYGALALQVDLTCPGCGHRRETCYVVAGDDGAFCQLITIEEEYLTDLRDGDTRASEMRCTTCRVGLTAAVDPLRRLTIRRADDPDANICYVVPVSALPPLFHPLATTIAADDFEWLVLRRGLTEISVSSTANTFFPAREVPPVPFLSWPSPYPQEVHPPASTEPVQVPS